MAVILWHSLRNCWVRDPLSATMHALSLPAHPFVTAYRLRGGDPLTLTEFVRAEIAMLSRPEYTYYAKFTLLWSLAPTTAGRCTVVQAAAQYIILSLIETIVTLANEAQKTRE